MVASRTPEMRLDRVATLYLFRPLQQLVRPNATRVPILMYHSISDSEEAGRPAYYRICTSPIIFADHLQFLYKHDYQPIGLSEAVRVMRGALGPKKPIVLTFDDGYQDFYTTAVPLLNKYKYSATVFLPTSYIGDYPQCFNHKRCLTWSQVKELRRAGIEFGSHTVTHPQLKSQKTVDVERELHCSKEKIEDKLGFPVRSFSYPYAFPEADRLFRQRLRVMLKKAGYENGVSTILGTAGASSDLFFLERLPVNSSDDLRFLSAKLTGAYDWLHQLQYASKRINWR